MIVGVITTRQREVPLYRPCPQCGDPGPHRLVHTYRLTLLLFFIPLHSANHQYVEACRRCGFSATHLMAPPGVPPLPFMHQHGWALALVFVLVGGPIGLFLPLIGNMFHKRYPPGQSPSERAAQEERASREKAEAEQRALDAQVKAVIATRDQIRKEDNGCTEGLLKTIPDAKARAKLKDKKPKTKSAVSGVPVMVTDAGLYSRTNDVFGTTQVCYTRLPDKLKRLQSSYDLDTMTALSERRAEADAALAKARLREIPPLYAFVDGACDRTKKKCTAISIWLTNATKPTVVAVQHASVPMDGEPEAAAMKRLGLELARVLNAWE